MPLNAPKTASDPSNLSKKRKGLPHSDNGRQNFENPRAQKRIKAQNARTILTQTSDAALSNGELDLQAFLKAREFEIKALEDGMRRSKGALTTRAFQQVPREMRRRTASHNVKRVPKRLQKRAAREMKEDNTPTVSPNKRKPGTSRARLRAETAKRLGLLAKKKRDAETQKDTAAMLDSRGAEGVVGRIPRPKVKKNALNVPPRPKSKFRKRQIHKTWLPTHIYHAKRARMTEPKNPLWRMAVPLTPTEKSYRPSHRAGNSRGALCWDMSYISTIGLEGPEASLEKVLRSVGITQDAVWSKAGERWREGKRTWSGWLNRDEKGRCRQIGPATAIWCSPVSAHLGQLDDSVKTKKVRTPPLHRLFLRVHPSAFLELWNEVLRVSKMQRPAVHVEDLRFEIGSIEITGPGSTEALLGILHPFNQSIDAEEDGHVKIFKALAGVTNSASLPSNALLTFSVMDPRLRYPPRKLKSPKADDEEAAFTLLETLANWPVDSSPPSRGLFDRECRSKATSLPSQKSINRRKGAAPPGEYPSRLPTDQPIPVLLYTSRENSSSSAQGTWTILAPWKCILPIWYCLMHYPLSSGSNPRFGGLQELQQMHFEHGKPWFPADYPGTDAGWAWEMGQRERRKKEWDRRPKGKRIEFGSLDLGGGRKGEIGLGWACDFERLSESATPPTDDKPGGKSGDPEEKLGSKSPPSPFIYIPSTLFSSLLTNPKLDTTPACLATVRITLFSRGVPLACARIYRLPRPQPSSEPTAPSQPGTANGAKPSPRSQWLSLAPSSTPSKIKTPKTHRQQPPISTLPTHLRQRALAQGLLQTPPLQYPAEKSASPYGSNSSYPIVPDEEDLIGFVTTGNFNLAEGKGTAVGSLLVERVLQGLSVEHAGPGRRPDDPRAGGVRGSESGDGGEEVSGSAGAGGSESGSVRRRAMRKEDRICIIRNAGENVGRLGIWEVV
jgi:ribonuclease P/MRP protein subunit POP1